MRILRTPAPAEFLIDSPSAIVRIFIEDNENMESKEWVIHTEIAARIVLLKNVRMKH